MLDISLCGHHFVAHPQRALYWSAQSMLLVADVHLGKTDTFRQFGISVPQRVQESDLLRLEHLLQYFQPQRCVVLGDLVHGRILGPNTVQTWNDLVHSHSGTLFELMVGNHDRNLQPKDLMLGHVHSSLQVDGVFLSHEPLATQELSRPNSLNIHGHIHCAMRVDGSRKKLPALAYSPPYLSMPAFSEFTAGVQAPADSQKIWVFAAEDDLVCQIS